MASMWRRTMVYLGLQDDEPEYGAEYDSYPDYGDQGDARDPYGADDDADRARRDHANDAEHTQAGRTATVAADRRPGGLPERRGRDDPTSPPSPRPSVVRTIGPTTAARVHIVEPQGFNDAQEVGDRLKANQPVILNLQGLSRELQRRLIDFSSGLAYAVGGQMARVSDQVFLLKPSDVEVSQEEKERLQARGLYQA